MISDANTTGSVRIRQAAVLALWLWLVPCGRVPVVAAPDYPGYRDLTVWTTSTNDPARPEVIFARTQFVYRGAKPVQLAARLQASPAPGFAGAKHAARLQPGETNDWTWSFTPAAGLIRAVIAGEIALDGLRNGVYGLLTDHSEKHSSGDPYWPPLAPSWALSEYNIERLLAHHRAQLAGPPSP